MSDTSGPECLMSDEIRSICMNTPTDMSSDDYFTYSVSRTEETTWYGKRVRFQMYFDDEPFYCAKMKSGQLDPISIARGTEVHNRGDHEYVLLSSKNLQTFSLRERDAKGKEVLLINMYRVDSSTKEPKNILLSFFSDNEAPERLASKKPVQTKDGHWYLDFSGRYAVPSIRNCIMVRETDLKEYFTVRKVEEWELEVDSLRVIPQIFVFALAIALWVSPI